MKKKIYLLSVPLFLAICWFYLDEKIIQKYYELIIHYDLTENYEIKNRFHDLYKGGESGNQYIKLGIIDGEIDHNHKDFSGIVIHQKSFVSTISKEDKVHGTSIAGVIAAKENGYGVVGISPTNIEIYNSIVLNNGFVSEDNVISGIYYCIENEVDIINISIEFSLFSENLKKALKEASDQDILVFLSNGNGQFRPHFTKSEVLNIPNVYLVGGLDINNQRSKYNLKSRKADIYFPGENIFSTDVNNTYSVFNGSSYATAIASGYAANLLKFRKKEDVLKYFENL